LNEKESTNKNLENTNHNNKYNTLINGSLNNFVNTNTCVGINNINNNKNKKKGGIPKLNFK